MSDLRIQVHPGPNFNSKQPRSDVLPPTPLRGIVLGPSGSGKTNLLVDLVLRLYRTVFERVYVFSPSVHLDSSWAPVKEYVERVLGVDQQQEPCFFDSWDTGALMESYETQVAVIREMKRRKLKELYNICIIVDDFADDPRAMHQSGGYTAGGSMLNTLFVRGRHAFISTIVSTQKLRLVSSTIRVNAQFFLDWRLRNRLELESLIEELSAVYDKKTLMEMYETATEEPFSFWYILLTARKREDMFYLRFEQRMIPADKKAWEESLLQSQEPLPEPLPMGGQPKTQRSTSAVAPLK